ncbi:hypothetical protein [Spiroplasma sp. AdecLV25b]|uniref:hypothetical protein n=1 Tax=Spiroplasma sp. AdecLV25b TaxID=3027162 RepID=UPI0027E014AF|nr:hypothetical protein [Spiroplasma sp. AdecLV25b]
MDKILTSQPLTKSNVLGQKQLTKLKNIPLPATLDLNLTRVYFTSGRDSCSRLLILIVHIFWIGLIFFNGIALGKLVANSSVLPPLPAVQKAVLQVITMIITILFAFIILIMMLPIFLAKTIRGIVLTCVVYLAFGTIINLMIMVLSFFMFFDTDSPYRLTIMILTISGMGFWWGVVINWWFSAKKSKKCLVQSIIKMYDLGYK